MFCVVYYTSELVLDRYVCIDDQDNEELCKGIDIVEVVFNELITLLMSLI